MEPRPCPVSNRGTVHPSVRARERLVTEFVASVAHGPEHGQQGKALELREQRVDETTR